jgi:hypothetical protein
VIGAYVATAGTWTGRVDHSTIDRNAPDSIMSFNGASSLAPEAVVISATDTIVWANSGRFADTRNDSSLTIASCCIAGGWTGTGNIATDPLLDSDHRPQAGSPCIDGGVDAGVATDIAHDPRPQGSAVDIGAFEQ